MSDRLKTMRRITAVQAQAKRIAEWKLATIEQRKATLGEAQTALAAFMDGGDLVGALATVALKQSRRVAQREAATEQDRQRQAAVVLKAQSRHKLAERMTETVARDERAAEDRRSLERLVEAFVATPAGRT